MKKIGVALLGLGVVGGGTYRILTAQREYIRQNDGIDIEIKCVLEKNLERCKELGVDLSIVSTDIDRVVNDPEISVVAEFFGGIEPAKTFLIKALEAGKSIVTANKEMFSKNWPELEAAAERGGGGLYFEASCAGGIPIIRTLTDGMQANRVTSLKGIVNGTTNYILSRMSDEGVDYAACLKDAQALGYAEADPTADVEGFDAMYKNSILSSLAYKKRVPVDRIYREGISGIAVEDINYGKELGYTLKLLAVSKNRDGKIEARVHPAFLQRLLQRGVRARRQRGRHHALRQRRGRAPHGQRHRQRHRLRGGEGSPPQVPLGARDGGERRRFRHRFLLPLLCPSHRLGRGGDAEQDHGGLRALRHLACHRRAEGSDLEGSRRHLRHSRDKGERHA